LTKVRIVILTNNQGNQIALANKLSEVCDISAVVFSSNIPKRRPNTLSRARGIVNSLSGRVFARKFRDAWNQVLSEYNKQYPEIPVSQVVRVNNINDKSTIETIERHSPDLVVVSGTNVVGSLVIAAAQKTGGIVNLHTGISPYVKGGPNCTNWCLAKGWFHLIGNTIMWLDRGIDTGNIIATERTPLDGNETLFDLHWNVMEHAHDLYRRSIERIRDNKPIPSVPQSSIARGVEFRGVQWNLLEMRRALRNFRTNYRPYFTDRNKLELDTRSISLISLNNVQSSG
jgi:methionyl-tRNA formyltransferase